MAEKALDIMELDSNRPWSDLPSDLLSLIESRLFFIRDRCAFRSVCRSWNMITYARLPTPLPPSFDTPYYDSPCLMVPQRSTTSWKVFHSVYNDFYDLDLPELANAEIRYSKSGWLLLSRGNTLFFFNPFARVQMEVPQSTHTFISLCFTCPPTSPDCFVFGIYSTSTVSTMNFGLINLGQEVWKDYYYVSPGEKFFISNNPPVFCNGKFYCLDRVGRICVFNPAAPVLHMIYDECDPPSLAEELCQVYMAEIDGEIWGVFAMRDNSRILVTMLDLDDLCWDTIVHLDSKCFYVGPNGSFAEASVDEAMANMIYFNKFYGKSGVLYSINSGSFRSVDCNYRIMGSCWLTEMGYNSVWIKPTSPPRFLNPFDSSTLTIKLNWV